MRRQDSVSHIVQLTRLTAQTVDCCSNTGGQGTNDGASLLAALCQVRRMFSVWASHQKQWAATDFDPEFVSDPKSARGPTRGVYKHRGGEYNSEGDR